jgi:hypothetical protein
VSAATPEDQVRHALAVIAKAPPAVFIAKHALRSRFSAALALVAQAITVFDEVRATGDQKDLEADGRLGDADLTGRAWEAADDLRGDLAQWSRVLTDWHEVREVSLSAFRTAVADSDSSSVEHYVAVAGAIEARWPSHSRRPATEGGEQ